MEDYKSKSRKIALVFLLCCVLVFIYKYKSHFEIDEFNSEVIVKMTKELQNCKNDYLFNYISFKDSIFKKELRFIDQIKIIKNDKNEFEPVSVKFRNPNWGKTFKVDTKTYGIIKKAISNPIYFDNLKKIENFDTIKNIVRNSNLKPVNASVISVKNYANIIYIFVIVNVNNYNNDCKQKEFETILNSIHDFVKK